MMLPLRTENLRAALAATLEEISHSGLFLLTDSNVATHVLPKILNVLTDKEEARIIEIPAGEDNKNLDTLTQVWSSLSEGGATRNSLLINLGGGVVTDLGGFAAASFKRGIRFVNIPTTVLGAVDAAVGGKTGIDFNGLKNEIGAFANAECVIISSEPLATLPREEILSGLGEIVKTAMISSGELYQKVLDDKILSDTNLLQDAMAECVRFKARVTEEDPHESGLRKILNFGHTAGHALESLMLTRHTPVTHGCAVANGILVALILSHMHLSLQSNLSLQRPHTSALFPADSVHLQGLRQTGGNHQPRQKEFRKLRLEICPAQRHRHATPRHLRQQRGSLHRPRHLQRPDRNISVEDFFIFLLASQTFFLRIIRIIVKNTLILHLS